MTIAAYKNRDLRKGQLQQLERLLTVLKCYQKVQNNSFLRALDTMFYWGSSSNCWILNGLRDIISCRNAGCGINELFGMERMLNLENGNDFAMEIVMSIYADMEVSFHKKTFSFSNLFYHALEQIEQGRLSADALTRIIRLVQGRRDRANKVYMHAKEAVRPDDGGVSREEQTAVTKQPGYVSYQQAEEIVSPPSRLGMFNFQDDHTPGTILVGKLQGYEPI